VGFAHPRAGVTPAPNGKRIGTAGVIVQRWPMVSLRNYLSRLCAEVADQTFKSGRAQIFPLFAAFATLVLQVVFRTSMSTDFRGNMLATVWPYMIAFAAYVLAQIVRAPLALDRQRADEIEQLKKQLGDVVSVKFEQITFRQPTPNLRNVTMVIQLLLRTGDSPATMHDWTLRSQAKPELKPVLSNILGLGKHAGGWTIRLDEHDQAHGSIFFDFSGLAQRSEDELRNTENGWILEFTDAHRNYAERIPDSLFRTTSA
jgi:hypothetical protein